MLSTLADRLRESMQGPPKVSGLDLANACKVAPASVSGWLSGKSKTMEASNLLAAARLLNVDPDWLATGVGRKARTHGVTQDLARYDAHTAVSWPLQTVSLEDIRRLSAFELGQVEGFIKGLLTAAQTPRKSNGTSG